MTIEIYDEILVKDGVHFSAKKNGRKYSFRVIGEALENLAAYHLENAPEDLNRLGVFEVHKDQIARVAEKLIGLNRDNNTVYIIDSDSLLP